MRIVTEKKCKHCGEIKPASEFRRCRSCKTCENEINKNRYHANKNEYLSRMTKYRHQARINAVNHYGGKCACCGEDHSEFLAIDHINGGGAKHQKSIKGMAIGIWLRKNKYPEGFRVLCHNCNQALGSFGYCPHGNLIR